MKKNNIPHISSLLKRGFVASALLGYVGMTLDTLNGWNIYRQLHPSASFLQTLTVIALPAIFFVFMLFLNRTAKKEDRILVSVIQTFLAVIVTQVLFYLLGQLAWLGDQNLYYDVLLGNAFLLCWLLSFGIFAIAYRFSSGVTWRNLANNLVKLGYVTTVIVAVTLLGVTATFVSAYVSMGDPYRGLLSLVNSSGLMGICLGLVYVLTFLFCKDIYRVALVATGFLCASHFIQSVLIFYL